MSKLSQYNLSRPIKSILKIGRYFPVNRHLSYPHLREGKSTVSEICLCTFRLTNGYLPYTIVVLKVILSNSSLSS